MLKETTTKDKVLNIINETFFVIGVATVWSYATIFLMWLVSQMSDIPTFNPFWSDKPKDDAKWKRQRRKSKGTALGWKWWHLRKDWLMYHPYCQRCEYALATEVHHIKPRHTHPELIYDLRNLMSLCSTCHKEIHKGDNNGTNAN